MCAPLLALGAPRCTDRVSFDSETLNYRLASEPLRRQCLRVFGCTEEQKAVGA